MSFVLCPTNPQHRTTIVSDNSSPLVIYSKYLTTEVSQKFWKARMPQESQIQSLLKVHAHQLQFAPTVHTIKKIHPSLPFQYSARHTVFEINSSSSYPDPLTLLVQMLPGHVQSGLPFCSGSEIFPTDFLKTKLGRHLWQLWQQLPPKKEKRDGEC